ncbi:pentatricopeptide repeat-containing protein At4g21170 [Typha angustifolia]|uniref:pentatricopeptide repeat-containing protein At4g21170 n=1 Tax=Typha angustifolia TaxID=59011 RepID=UPI003C2F80E0
MPFNPTLPTSLKWRQSLKQRSLASQISSLILQRKDWIPLLRSNSSLLSTPTSSLLFRILSRTQSHPETSLQFFHWITTDFRFQPDLRSLSKVIQILVDADRVDLLDSARRLLLPVIKSDPSPAPLLDSMLRVSASCKDSRSRLLSFLLASYCQLGCVANALDTFNKIRVSGCVPTTASCNSLLDALCSSKRSKTAWCVYAAAVRMGCSPDSSAWDGLARLLCEEGKLEKAKRLLNLRNCGTLSYELVINCYCRKGEFGSAFSVLKRMDDVNLPPDLRTFTAILDAGCKFGDVRVIKLMLREMIVRGLLLTTPFLDYGWIVERLCEVDRSYAAEMFFKRANSEKFLYESSLFMSMLSALSKVGRVEEAVRFYTSMMQEGVAVNLSCCDVFVSGICNGEPSEEVDQVLKDLIKRGFIPNASDLSKYVAVHCNKGLWKEASNLLDLALDKGILLDVLCCCYLVDYYCANGLTDTAIGLHGRIRKLGGCLNATSYNMLLRALFSERRIEEAIKFFDYMREKNVLDSESYVIMIRSLCHEKELRKAMDLHDEMLKLRFKPDDATYKRLISGFVYRNAY